MGGTLWGPGASDPAPFAPQAKEAAGGTLTDSELNLLALYCCGFSRTVIMVTMGYNNIGTIYNKKIQIAKKLGVNDLDDFVRLFVSN